MSVVSQFYTTSSTQKKQNRRIFIGPASVTWQVPPGVTEVEVHCWGGGGNGVNAAPPAPSYNGGGGGGYVTHVYPVSGGTDRLSITVGGQGGTSSVNVPTQGPTSPIAATGGSPGFTGAGGGASFSIAPGINTSRTFSANGGDGGRGSLTYGSGGGGGGAGFIYGPGGPGGDLLGDPLVPLGSLTGGSGGGIKGSGFSLISRASSIGSAGGGFLPAPATNTYLGGAGVSGKVNYGITPSPVGAPAVAGSFLENSSEWFYLDEIDGRGGSIVYGATQATGPQAYIQAGAGGGGCGGAGGNGSISGQRGGIFGGGGGGGSPNGGSGAVGGDGGFAAGGGGANGAFAGAGGAGIVIIYW